MVAIWVEPSYSNSSWCARILSGLVTELRKKRMSFQHVQSLDDNAAQYEFVFLIGSYSQWVEGALKLCNYMGVYPILLCNQAFSTFAAEYSIVCSDIAGSMRYLIQKIYSRGCQHIALYGVNPSSVSDSSRMTGFVTNVGKEDANYIFYNNGSLEECYETFIHNLHHFNGNQTAVICVNDFSAVSLVKKLRKRRPALLTQLIITSCAETWLSDYYREHIKSIKMNFENFGKAAVSILQALQRNDHISHMNMMIKWDISYLGGQGPSTSKSAFDSDPIYALMQHKDTFYDDHELIEMLKAETLLSHGGKTNRDIIELLALEKTYEEIGDACYLAESTVKYRVNNMIKECGLNSRKELVTFLQNIIYE